MKKISVGHGKYAIVDNEDYSLLSRHKWCTNNGYPCKNIKTRQILMSYFIMATPINNKTKLVYFKNHNSLDLRKKNMEFREYNNHAIGQAGRIKTSKYKGVCWDKKSKKWNATISKRYNGKRKKSHLGYFVNERKAARVYNKKAKELFGKYAYQNKI